MKDKMNTSPLVLSLFPGIGLFDYAFEMEGFCVVRGPDVLWGGCIRRFNPPAGKFDGVIGGPPCQAFSSLAHLNRGMGVEPKFGNLVPEFARCVREADATWFVMEEVPAAPKPVVDGMQIVPFMLTDRECGGATSRKRLIVWGDKLCRDLQFPLRLLAPNDKPALAVTGSARVISTGKTIRRRENGIGDGPGYSARLSVAEMIQLQGLPEDFFEHSPFTAGAQRQMIGNGVPIPMGRAIARAVREAVESVQ